MAGSSSQNIARILGEWIEATVWSDGMRLDYRIRIQKPPEAGQYPHLIIATWEGERREREEEFERRLVDALEGYKVAWLSVRFSNNSATEWYWYARDPEECMNFINLALEELEPFPVEFAAQNDAGWQVYEEIRGQLR